MPAISCPKSRCQWKSDDLSEATAMLMVNLHLKAEHEMKSEEKKAGAKT